MTKTEQHLEAMLKEHSGMTPARVERAIRAVQAEHRTALSSTRDAALEQARRAAVAQSFVGLSYDEMVGARTTAREIEARIRALKPSPVALIPADRVREKLLAAWRLTNGSGKGLVEGIAKDLGVDLDAKAEPATTPRRHIHGECRDDCPGYANDY